AGFVDSVTKNSFDLLAYFGARSGIAKILKNFHYQLWAKSEEGNATGSTTVQGYMKYLAQLPKPIFKAMNVFEKTYTRRSVAYYTISPQEIKDYYQKIIDHHAKNFTDYLLQLGWEASHHVMP
ncbi:MAG: hypothetical protein V4490_07370, partial [Pseudomonadota bacterium]